jgi:hypothetical protein
MRTDLGRIFTWFVFFFRFLFFAIDDGYVEQGRKERSKERITLEKRKRKEGRGEGRKEGRKGGCQGRKVDLGRGGQERRGFHPTNERRVYAGGRKE